MSHIYMFIREDIPPAQKIVQIGHASYEAGKLFQDEEGISSMVLLSAKDEEDLLNISEKLGLRQIDFYMFYEPDNGMGYSAICTQPIIEPRERAFFKRWQLFRHTA